MSRPTGRQHSRGFTFMETLCILLVVVFGLLGVLALVSWGLGVAGRAQAQMTGLATATSVATDPQPMRAIDWSYTPYNFDTPSPTPSTAQGYLNGYWLIRTETTTPSDIIATDGTTVYARSALITVEAYETMNGRSVASFQTRIVRQRGEPRP